MSRQSIRYAALFVCTLLVFTVCVPSAAQADPTLLQVEEDGEHPDDEIVLEYPLDVTEPDAETNMAQDDFMLLDEEVPPPEPDMDTLSRLPADASVRTASTAEELFELLEHDVGGTIHATGDIVVDDLFFIDVTRAVTVDMGEHTLRVEYWLMLEGPVHVTGGKTVLQVETMGTLTTNGDVRIRAEGNGAVAVRAEAYASLDLNFARVEAVGESAVGIDVDGDAYLHCIDVRVRGADSVGVRATDEVELFLSEVNAQEQSIVSGTGDILLDCATATPHPQEARQLSRTAAVDDSVMVVEAGTPIDDMSFADVPYAFHLEADNPDPFSPQAFVPLVWDLAGFDHDLPGEYAVPVQVEAAFAARFPMVDWRPGQVVILVQANGAYIVDVIQQEFDESAPSGDPDNLAIRLLFELLTPLQPDDVVRVYCQEEHADHWRPVGDEWISKTPYGFAVGGFYESDIFNTYDFYIEIVRDGETLVSNMVTYTITTQKGGDRNDTDRAPTDGDGNDTDRSPTRDRAAGAGSSELQDSGDIAVVAADRGDDIPGDTGSEKPAAPVLPSVATRQGISYNAVELAHMLEANPVTVPFLSDGMTLLIPTPALSSIVLDEGELFFVDMGLEEPHRFYFRLYRGMQMIVSLEDVAYTVILPDFLADGLDRDNLLCTHDSGTTATVAHDGAVLTVIVAHTGAYTLSSGAAETPPAVQTARVQEDTGFDAPRTSAAADAPGATANIPLPAVLAGSAVFGAGGGVFLWRKKAHRP